ncbi:sigma-70 family RNA polymerase sigma factor [Streptomyces sp. NBC_01571]|uniref:sigma-70 family RNA polymerase sigma factor n=1 Tax=unclassified Streptomyces TaxID=2593676 RepID=UPI002259B511|nr:sigma-70 family RNA polymerase sigma factor [Streptomyces sp. NBC_01571]MCX4571929.1 sigma-70 family RNA polymerase sigma factor [Streptomyces sp. NBC_01571]
MREPDLVARAQQGDPDAFAELYRQHHRAIFRFVYHRVGRNRALAEDITGEVFLRALSWLRTGAFSWRGAGFGGWLSVIARNKIADHFKSSQRREFPVYDMRDHDATVDSAEEAVLKHMEDDLVRQALARLLPPQRQVLELRYLQDHSVAEAALAIERNTGALKTLQYRAVQSLRAVYEEGSA